MQRIQCRSGSSTCLMVSNVLGCICPSRAYHRASWPILFEAATIDAATVTGIFVAAIKACGSLRDLRTGRKIHGNVVAGDTAKCIWIENSLVNMYGKCGRMEDARCVFESMKHRSVVSWTALIFGYVENGEDEIALRYFSRMQQKESDAAPNERTFMAALMACSSLAAKERGRDVNGELLKLESLQRGATIHEQADRCGYCEDAFVSSTLVDMYAKCGSLAKSRNVFEKMANPSVVSWTALIQGHAESNNPEMALEIFQLMESKGCMPNSRTFVSLFIACGRLATTEEGRRIEDKVVKPKALESGRKLHFQAAKSGLDSDLFVASSLIDMYTHCGSLADAKAVFDGIKPGRHDVVTWTRMIQGYAENGEADAALELFERMRQENCAPNSQTYVAVLLACGNATALDTGRSMHGEICRYGLETNEFVSSCLLDLYGKCGRSCSMEQYFDLLPARSSILWSALISGYSCQGQSRGVFEAFEMMREEDVEVDRVTFLCVLSACSHAGLVERGKRYFSMLGECGIPPSLEHYHCMADLLGRANRLDEAVELVRSMRFKPTLVTWMTVLGACCKWKNVEIGRTAFQSLLEIDPSHTPAFVLMANIYGSVGMLEEKRSMDEYPTLL